MRYFFFIGCLSLLASCTAPEKLLCKTWKIDDVVFENVKDTMLLQQNTGIKQQLLGGTTFTFKPDSTFTVTTKVSQNSGTWWLSPDKKHFSNRSVTGVVQSKIDKLNNQKLVFESVDANGQTMRFICVPTDTK